MIHKLIAISLGVIIICIIVYIVWHRLYKFPKETETLTVQKICLEYFSDHENAWVEERKDTKGGLGGFRGGFGTIGGPINLFDIHQKRGELTMPGENSFSSERFSKKLNRDFPVVLKHQCKDVIDK
jgi:hypothetical protein